MSVYAKSTTNYQVQVQAGNHSFLSDEPIGIGDDAGPCPFDLVLAGLASCMIITVEMYARRKGWPLEHVEISLELHSVEVRTPDGGKTRDSVVETALTFLGPLSAEQMKRLEVISSHCPVHRMLEGNIQIRSRVTNVQAF